MHKQSGVVATNLHAPKRTARTCLLALMDKQSGLWITRPSSTERIGGLRTLVRRGRVQFFGGWHDDATPPTDVPAAGSAFERGTRRRVGQLPREESPRAMHP